MIDAPDRVQDLKAEGITMDVEMLEARVNRVASGEIDEAIFTAEELAQVRGEDRRRFSRLMDARINTGELSLERGPDGRAFRLTRA